MSEQRVTTDCMLIVCGDSDALEDWSGGDAPDGRTVSIDDPPDYMRPPFTDFDAGLAAVVKKPTARLELPSGTAIAVGGESCRFWKHPTNPMVYMVFVGSDDDVGWVTNNSTMDDWKDTGARLEIAGKLGVAAGDRAGRGAESVELPAGTYQVREIRDWTDAGELVVLLVIADDFASDLE